MDSNGNETPLRQLRPTSMIRHSRMDVVTEIEEAFVAHWSVFGHWAQGELHEEDGILRFETPIRHLPYNGVIRTRSEETPTQPWREWWSFSVRAACSSSGSSTHPPIRPI